jgi:hypothetical protein
MIIISSFILDLINIISLNSTVELQDGKIEIDGLDISNMELSVLRNRLALVPQDATLFLGTLRDNLYDSFFYIFVFLTFILVDSMSLQRSSEHAHRC